MNMKMSICLHCDEPIEDGSGEAFWKLTDEGLEPGYMHEECEIRLVIGGLNHLRERCECFGGTEPPDPIGVSRHKAAMLTVAYWRLHGN